MEAKWAVLRLAFGRVFVRREQEVLGTVSLNISGCPDAAAPALPRQPGGAPHQELSPLGAAVAQALAALVPRCVAMPITIPQVCLPWMTQCVCLGSSCLHRLCFVSHPHCLGRDTWGFVWGVKHGL